MRVSDPTGQSWRVSRRWVPWRRRLKGSLDGVPDLPALGDDPISAIVGVVFLIILVPFLLLAAVAGVELLLLLLVLPFALLGRVVLGRHWTVEVRKGWTPYWEVRAGDWQASTVRIHEVVGAIREGRLPPQTIGTARVTEG